MKAREAGLDDTAVALLDDGMTARDAVVALLGAKMAAQALRLQVYLMPRAYVLPWVCERVRDVPLDASDAEGVRLAGQWLRGRDEASRRAALMHAEAAGYAGLGAHVAACAGWSEGCLVDARGNELGLVGPHMMATAANAALLTLAARREDLGMHEACAAIVRSGLDLLPKGGSR